MAKIIPMPPVSSEEFVPLVHEALQAIAAIGSENEALRVFAGVFEKKVISKAAPTGFALYARGMTVLLAVLDHKAELLKAGLAVASESNRAHSYLSPALFIGAAHMKVGAEVKPTGEFKAHYRIQDLVEAGKKYMTSGPARTVGMGSNVELSLPGHEVDAMETLLSRIPKKAVEDFMESPSTRGWRPKLDDFPEYRAMCEDRERKLAQLAPHQRSLYSSAPLPPDHSSVKAMESMVAMVPEEMRKGMMRLSLIGPWSFYAHLDEAAGWSYSSYRDLVLRSELTASIPCLAGNYPAHYIGRHGSDEEFLRVLELFPDAMTEESGHGRPLILDICQERGTEMKFQMLLACGADPNTSTPAGLSLMAMSIQQQSFEKVALLLEYGYDHNADLSMDQDLLDVALDSSRLEGDLRMFLFQLKGNVPKKSKLSELMEPLKRSVHAATENMPAVNKRPGAH